jgi:hypothetical protein
MQVLGKHEMAFFPRLIYTTPSSQPGSKPASTYSTTLDSHAAHSRLLTQHLSCARLSHSAKGVWRSLAASLPQVDAAAALRRPPCTIYPDKLQFRREPTIWASTEPTPHPPVCSAISPLSQVLLRPAPGGWGWCTLHSLTDTTNAEAIQQCDVVSATPSFLPMP